MTRRPEDEIAALERELEELEDEKVEIERNIEDVRKELSRRKRESASRSDIA
jgi:cell division protein FtsB